MATLNYPSSSELRLIEPIKLPRLEAARPILRHFPIRTADHHLLEWEQKDNYLGLQQVRGLNGQPLRVNRVGAKRYIEQPGVYGEFVDIDERELTMRRPWGNRGDMVVSIDDLVMEAQDQLLLRRLDRIEWVIWTLLVTGTFSVLGPAGGAIATGAYTTQLFTAGVTWATVATATPLANFRAIQLLGRGSSSVFDQGAEAWMNRATFNSMISNTNANDLAGRRTSGLNTVLNLEEVSRVLAGEGLPQIVIYDQGYFTDAAAFTLFIPDNKVAVIGRRTNGDPLGEYRMTRNVNNPNFAPGSYTHVIDRIVTANGGTVPRSIEVHDGHNGGPVLEYPGGIVIMTV
jgi:hypothetical protein